MYTARYDLETGDIQGIFEQILQDTPDSVIISQEVKDNPHFFKIINGNVVKKSKTERDAILASRAEWQTKKEREKNTFAEIDNIINRLTLIEQRLTKAGL